MSIFAFDFFDTLTDGVTTTGPVSREDVRELARQIAAKGHEIHIVSAISPASPYNNDNWYRLALRQLNVPVTMIHRVDHDDDGHLKAAVLQRIGAVGFWDDNSVNVYAARVAGIPSCHVGVEDCSELRKIRR